MIADALRDVTGRGDAGARHLPWDRAPRSSLLKETGRVCFGVDLDAALCRCRSPALAGLSPSTMPSWTAPIRPLTNWRRHAPQPNAAATNEHHELARPHILASPNEAPRPAVDDAGYGRPPRAHQFKPGQSGNLQGRPKGAKSEATILRAILNRKIEVREGGRPRKMTVLEPILLRFTEDALKGNTKTAAFLFNSYAGNQTGEPQRDEISADDREVLDAFARRFEAQRRHKRQRP